MVLVDKPFGHHNMTSVLHGPNSPIHEFVNEPFRKLSSVEVNSGGLLHQKCWTGNGYSNLFGSVCVIASLLDF